MVQISETVTENPPTKEVSKLSKSTEVNWVSVLFFIHVHLLSIYGAWLVYTEVKVLTIIFLILLTSFAILGVTTGAHRLWAHRTYKASTGLRVALMLCQTLAGQGPIYDWVQYHRFHHAHHGTDADPYDHNKGFIYAHILTRMRKLSPYQEKLKEQIDMSDLESDSVVMFQKKVYWLLYGVFFLLLPLNAPLEYWGDSVLSAIFVIGFLRYGIVLHAAWLVESGICIWGLKPGEKYPHDSNSVFILTKSFWPHYHYLVPYDYKSGEFGTYDSGCSTAFIRVWAALGLATDLRTADTTAIQKAIAESAKTKTPITKCLDEEIAKQDLPNDHFLKQD